MRRNLIRQMGICFAALAASLALSAQAAAQSANTNSPQPSAQATQAPTAAAASSPAAVPVPAPATKKPKKVWTNDEIGSVGGTISVVGGASNSSTASSGAGGNPSARSGLSPNGGSGGARQRQLAAYRRQIRQLQAQIAAADAKISELRSFKGENTAPSEGINPREHYSMTPVSGQIQQQKDNKKKLQAQLENIEDEARKNGFEPGDLR